MRTVYERLVRNYGFSPSQKKIIEMVSGGEVLEVGSSSGYMTEQFFRNGNVVDIVEINEAAARDAGKLAREVFTGSIEGKDVQSKIRSKYDFIVCADVLEHLVNPQKVLLFLKHRLKKDGVILISIPNVACWDMRISLMRGKFDYRESGLLDRTHLRFYTYKSFLKLLKNCGYKIGNIFYSETKIPLENTLSKIPLLGIIIAGFIKPTLVREYPNLTVIHYVVQAK